MLHDQKVHLLKSIRVLMDIGNRPLVNLAEHLRPHELEDGQAVFVEGTIGVSVYFVMAGKIQIVKRFGTRFAQELALLFPGDFFGEMALVDEEAMRSASAISRGRAVLFELSRADLNKWIKQNPEQGMKLFAGLLNTQSQRLRRTSQELALYYDLSNLELPFTEETYLVRVMDQIVRQLDGGWFAAAYHCQRNNKSTQLIASRGIFKFEELLKKTLSDKQHADVWIDDATFYLDVPIKKESRILLIFHADSAVHQQVRNRIEHLAPDIFRLMDNALEMIRWRNGSTKV